MGGPGLEEGKTEDKKGGAKGLLRCMELGLGKRQVTCMTNTGVHVNLFLYDQRKKGNN